MPIFGLCGLGVGFTGPASSGVSAAAAAYHCNADAPGPAKAESHPADGYTNSVWGSLRVLPRVPGKVPVFKTALPPEPALYSDSTRISSDAFVFRVFTPHYFDRIAGGLSVRAGPVA